MDVPSDVYDKEDNLKYKYTISGSSMELHVPAYVLVGTYRVTDKDLLFDGYTVGDINKD